MVSFWRAAWHTGTTSSRTAASSATCQATGATWERGRDVGVGVERIEIEPGKWSTVAHTHGAEEELFYVLAGSGLSCSGTGRSTRSPRATAWSSGPIRSAHASRRPGQPRRPRVRDEGRVRSVTSLGQVHPAGWALGRARRAINPWPREVAAGEPPVGEVSRRSAPSRQHRRRAAARRGRTSKPLGGAGWRRRDPSSRACNTRRSLAGAAQPALPLRRGGDLRRARGRRRARAHAAPGSGARGRRPRTELRGGASSPAACGTKVAHSFLAGSADFTFLAYGTRESNDIAYYPRSIKVYFRRGPDHAGRAPRVRRRRIGRLQTGLDCARTRAVAGTLPFLVHAQGLDQTLSASGSRPASLRISASSSSTSGSAGSSARASPSTAGPRRLAAARKSAGAGSSPGPVAIKSSSDAVA